MDGSVHNVRRKMASLPPISSDEYNGASESLQQEDSSSDEATERGRPLSTTQPKEEQQVDGEDNEDLPSPSDCLFCTSTSATVAENVAHMKTEHSFQISSIEKLQTDIETFISYLALVITRCYSCLYCSKTKHSAEAIRAHMRSRGHCMLDLSPGSEFLEFWSMSGSDEGDTEDNDVQFAKQSSVEGIKMLSDTEMLLPSGAVASSRDVRVRPQARRDKSTSNDDMALVRGSQQPDSTENAEAGPSSTIPSQSRALARRDEMGIMGIGDQQRRALLAVEKKVQLNFERRNNARRWALAKIGNTQKHYRAGGPGLPSYSERP